MSLKLPELIDIPSLQMLMDRFHAATGIPVGIIGSDGEFFVATGWQDICSVFHRSHPVTAERCRQSDDFIKSRLSTEGYIQYKCLNGLWDMAKPIIIAGEHLATLYLGQFRYDDEEIDDEFFRRQALEFGFDLDGYIAAIRRIPVFSRERVRQIMEFYTSLVDHIVSTGVANFRQRETARSLRESEERHRALFECANDAILTLRDGCFADCNSKALEMFGCSRKELIGRRPEHFSSHLQPDGLESAPKAYEKLTHALDGHPQFFEWRHRRSDGTYFDVEISLNLLEYNGRNELLAVIRDVTERKRTEEVLRLVEERFRSIFWNLSAGMAIASPDGSFIEVNPAFCRFLGYTTDELIRLTVEEVTHPDDLEDTLRLRAEAAAGETPTFSLEKRFLSKEGATVWGHASTTWFYDNGAPIYYVALIQDVTERKRAELALKVSEEEKSLILNSTMDLIVYHDSDMKILWGNRMALESVGMGPEEFARQDCWKLWHQRTEPCEGCPVVLALETGVPHDAEMRTPDGRRWDIRGFPVKDNDGRVKGAVQFCLDITERKRMEEQIEVLNTDLAARAYELELANRELEAFGYTVSHDLRSPLTGIQGYCQVLLELCSDRLGDQGAGFVREVSKSADKMDELITTMLDFSKLSRRAMSREMVDLTAIARTLSAQLRVREPGRKVTFIIAEDAITEGDPALLPVVLENLIGNAWKYTSRKDDAVIEFGAVDTAVSRAFFVRDNGAGFDMAHAEKLFSPFQRLPGATGFSGHGIGLATVQRIIQRHGGRVWGEGEPGSGATFYFTI